MTKPVYKWHQREVLDNDGTTKWEFESLASLGLMTSWHMYEIDVTNGIFFSKPKNHHQTKSSQKNGIQFYFIHIQLVH